jgi:hypothetical protein
MDAVDQDLPPSVEQICNAIRRRESEADHRLAVAEAYIEQLVQQIDIVRKRLAHTESELAQARVSRDAHALRVTTLLAAIDDAGLEVVGMFWPTSAHIARLAGT